MQRQARGGFEVQRTPQGALDAGDGVEIGHVRFDKRFHGPLDATSVVHMLAVGTDMVLRNHTDSIPLMAAIAATAVLATITVARYVKRRTPRVDPGAEPEVGSSDA